MSNDQPTWRPPDAQGPPDPRTPRPRPPGEGQVPPSAQQPLPPYSQPPVGPGWAAPPGAPAGPPGYAYWPHAGQPPAPRSNRTLIIVVSLVIGGLLLALLVLAYILGSSLSSLAEFGARTPIEQVPIGQCFNGISSTDFADNQELSVGLLFGVEVVDCAEEHEGELVGRSAWPAGSPDEFPGDEEVETFAFNECLVAFEAYVGRSYFDSTLELTYTFPRRASWIQGSRGVECIAHPPAGVEKEAGSVRGSDR